MTATISRPEPAAEADEPTRRREVRRVLVVLAVLWVVLAGMVTAYGLATKDHASGTRTVPQSAAMEGRLGVRFTRVAVVGDGGLVTLSYVVLDAEQASRFQSDLAHPPVLTSESRAQSTARVSLMRAGHALRPGQTYYLVYQNTRGAVRPHELVTVGYGRLRLRHVPVV